MWLVNFFFRISVGIVVFIVVFYWVFLSERQKSVAPSAKQWIGREFEIKKMVCVHRYKNDQKERYYLEPFFPGASLNDPLMRMNLSHDWQHRLMPGVRFRIVKIFKHVTPCVGELLVIEAIMLEGEYRNFKVLVEELFEYDPRSFQIFGPKEEIVCVQRD